MVRKRSGEITSTTCPIARNSATTVVSVRTTPFTCGSHASVTISSRCDGAGGSITSHSASWSRASASDSFAQRGSARRKERQAVDRRPVDQFQPPVMMLDQGGTAFHPVAVVQVQHALHLAHLGVMDVATHHAVKAAAARLARQRALEPIDRLHRFFYLALQPG